MGIIKIIIYRVSVGLNLKEKCVIVRGSLSSNTQSKVIEFFSEDIATIRACIWNDFTIRLKGEQNERRDELDKMMEIIYNELYCSGQGKQIILEDKDRRGYLDVI